MQPFQIAIIPPVLSPANIPMGQGIYMGFSKNLEILLGYLGGDPAVDVVTLQILLDVLELGQP